MRAPAAHGLLCQRHETDASPEPGAALRALACSFGDGIAGLGAAGEREVGHARETAALAAGGPEVERPGVRVAARGGQRVERATARTRAQSAAPSPAA